MTKKKENDFLIVKPYDKAQIYYYLLPKKYEPKSIFLELSGLILINDEQPVKKLRHFYKQLRQKFEEFNKQNIFNEKYIVVEKLPESFKKTSSCFYSAEFTLFPKTLPINRSEILKHITDLSDFMYSSVIEKNNQHRFYRNLSEKRKISLYNGKE